MVLDVGESDVIAHVPYLSDFVCRRGPHTIHRQGGQRALDQLQCNNSVTIV
jgi:hypothetical protein